MAHMYSEVPAGGLMHVPPAIPTGMLYRVKQIQNVSKQTIKIVPLTGQTSATNTQKIIVNLPPNSLVDLATFEMNFTGATAHNGNSGASNLSNYVQKRYFPRNIASIIENLEIKINGQSRQNINQYGYLYNILNDYTCGNDNMFKNRIGANADPSNKTIYVNGQARSFRGYPVGNLVDVSGAPVGTALDQDYYSIRTWLGFLGGNTSTTIIDTSLYGDITIEITLADGGCLSMSSAVGTLTALANVNHPETGAPINPSGNSAVALVAATGTGYTLSNIGFQITRYDIAPSYYQAVASVLESGSVFKLYYPNYLTFSGTQQSLPKAGTTRFTLSTQSLDMVISTFQLSDRTTQGNPVIGNIAGPAVEVNADISGSTLATTFGEYGKSAYTFANQLALGASKTLNNSRYYLRNGDGIVTNTYIVGSVRLIPESILEQFNGVLRAFNAQNDVLGGLYPGIQSLAHYQSQFYSHILSLNISSEHDMYTVSGLNCSTTPIAIGWEITSGGTGSGPSGVTAGQPSGGSGSVAYVDVSNGTTNNTGNIFTQGTLTTNPIMYACFTSRLEVSAGRQILTYT